MKEIQEIWKVLQELNMCTVIFRLTLSAVCGGVLGIERAKNNQVAGMRTYMLVCIGAAVVMLTSQYMVEIYQTGDPARLGAQVISGIGFLGAGSIMTGGRQEVKGLTTAAGLWVAACIGLAVGIGFYSGGIVATIAVLFTVSVLKPVAYHFSRNNKCFGLYIEVKRAEYLPEVYRIIENLGADISNIDITEVHEDGSCTSILSIKLQRDKKEEDFIKYVRVQKWVKEVKYISYL